MVMSQARKGFFFFLVAMFAVLFENIEIMKILLQYNCQMNSNEVVENALGSYNYRLFYWLVKNRIVALKKELYDMAEDHQEIKEWLVRHNCPK